MAAWPSSRVWGQTGGSDWARAAGIEELLPGGDGPGDSEAVFSSGAVRYQLVLIVDSTRMIRTPSPIRPFRVLSTFPSRKSRIMSTSLGKPSCVVGSPTCASGVSLPGEFDLIHHNPRIISANLSSQDRDLISRRIDPTDVNGLG